MKASLLAFFAVSLVLTIGCNIKRGLTPAEARLGFDDVISGTREAKEFDHYAVTRNPVLKDKILFVSALMRQITNTSENSNRPPPQPGLMALLSQGLKMPTVTSEKRVGKAQQKQRESPIPGVCSPQRSPETDRLGNRYRRSPH